MKSYIEVVGLIIIVGFFTYVIAVFSRKPKTFMQSFHALIHICIIVGFLAFTIYSLCTGRNSETLIIIVPLFLISYFIYFYLGAKIDEKKKKEAERLENKHLKFHITITKVNQPKEDTQNETKTNNTELNEIKNEDDNNIKDKSEPQI